MKFSGGYQIKDQNALYFITFATIGFIDVFSKKMYRDVLLESLKHCQEKKGLEIWSWVIMSNHVHFIFSAAEGYALSNILRDFKKYTANKILHFIENPEHERRSDWMLKVFSEAGQRNSNNVKYQFWQQESHPIELYSEKWINQKRDYIHDNPVAAGIVEHPEDYLYSSARSYCGLEGLLCVGILN